MANFKNVGTWWSSSDVDMVEIDDKVYALDGWNGETYLKSWECIGEDHMDASEGEYQITPIYENEDIVGYEVR